MESGCVNLLAAACSDNKLDISMKNKDRYKWYVVGMLWCICLLNYADREAIFSLFPLLQKEMHLTTIQLGLLGSGFAWVYGLMAPFAGSIVDRIRRKTAIMGGLFTWSTIAILTPLAHTFHQLFGFMAIEGLGETFYYPASMSMVSDYHGKRTRSRAMGMHQTSVYMGTIAGGFFAGLIGERYGWRWSFIVFGSLGIVLGFVLLRLLREPERGAADLEEQAPGTEAHLHRPDLHQGVHQNYLADSQHDSPDVRLCVRQFCCRGAAVLDAQVSL